MTEVRIPAPVKARRVDDLFPPSGEEMPPGSFKFHIFGGEPDGTPPAGLHFTCPCGCKGVWGITFRTYQGRPGPVWTWNGDFDRPDCDPSIQTFEATKEAPPHWHGFLRNGEFIQA